MTREVRCGCCDVLLPDPKRRTFSRFTRNSYCWDIGACDRRRARRKKKKAA